MGIESGTNNFSVFILDFVLASLCLKFHNENSFKLFVVNHEKPDVIRKCTKTMNKDQIFSERLFSFYPLRIKVCVNFPMYECNLT